MDKPIIRLQKLVLPNAFDEAVYKKTNQTVNGL